MFSNKYDSVTVFPSTSRKRFMISTISSLFLPPLMIGVILLTANGLILNLSSNETLYILFLMKSTSSSISPMNSYGLLDTSIVREKSCGASDTHSDNESLFFITRMSFCMSSLKSSILFLNSLMTVWSPFLSVTSFRVRFSILRFSTFVFNSFLSIFLSFARVYFLKLHVPDVIVLKPYNVGIE